MNEETKLDTTAALEIVDNTLLDMLAHVNRQMQDVLPENGFAQKVPLGGYFLGKWGFCPKSGVDPKFIN
jgi:hypothetical protein